MSIFLPWNHRPSSTSGRKTGMYSLPAGKFARVTVLDNSTAFSIGGVVVIPANSFLTGNASTSATDLCLVRYNMRVEASVAASSATTSIIVNSNTFSMTVTGTSSSSTVDSIYGEIIANDGATVQTTFSNVSGGTSSVVANLDYFTPAKKEYWVDAGVALDGGIYYVEEYDVP